MTNTSEEEFREEVSSCVDDLNEYLPELAKNYGEVVVVDALSSTSEVDYGS